MANEKQTEVETEISTIEAQAVQEEIVLDTIEEEVKVERKFINEIKDKIDEVKSSIKEQGDKTATKKDVWKAAITNAIFITGGIVVGVVFGV